MLPVDTRLDRLGGVALVAGYLLVLVLPTAGATRGVGLELELVTLVALVVLPFLGLIAGAYAYVEGPFSGVGLFVFGSYLGVVGVGVTVAAALAAGAAAVLLGFGVVLFVLSLVALLGAASRFSAFLGIGGPAAATSERPASRTDVDEAGRSDRP